MATTSGSTSERLYSRDVLRLAMSLSEWPFHNRLPRRAELRSATCGSRLRVEIALDDDDRISEIGIDAQSCALGQASAAILASRVIGRSREEIAAGLDTLTAMLDAAIDPQDAALIWPGIDTLSSAQGLSARRPSILLPFQATIAAIDGLTQHTGMAGQ